MSDLRQRQEQVWARALVAARKALWQHRGQTHGGHGELEVEATVVARAVFAVAI